MPPSTDALLTRLLEGIERELPRAVALRRRLHAAPELAHAEQQTAASVAAELPVSCEAVAGTGRIARVDPSAQSGSRAGAARDSAAGGGGTGAVAVRAELDALPLRERTGAPFAASGDAMHACGHDVHMAALVALARAAHALGDALPAPLLAVFQPSEEAYPSGAQQLAEAELAELAPAAVVAAHIHPELPWGTVGLDPGTVNASCDAFEIAIEGEPSHGAYPHRGRDPILAIAQVVVALHAQLGRRIDPLHPASLTVGVLEGGSAENVIPRARTRARSAARTPTAGPAGAARAGRGGGDGGGRSARLPRKRRAGAGRAGARERPGHRRARTRAARRAPDSRRPPAWRSCGSDDFAFFGALAPLAMAFVGLDGADGFSARPLHHPELLPPDDAVGTVARAQAVLYVAAASVTATSASAGS